MRSALQALVDGNVIVEQTSKAWTIKQALESSEQLDELIESMNWNLFEAPTATRSSPRTIRWWSMTRSATRSGPRAIARRR